MISQLQGTVKNVSENSIIITMGQTGIGMEITVPNASTININQESNMEL